MNDTTDKTWLNLNEQKNGHLLYIFFLILSVCAHAKDSSATSRRAKVIEILMHRMQIELLKKIIKKKKLN